jgi:hypothetical protein
VDGTTLPKAVVPGAYAAANHLLIGRLLCNLGPVALLGIIYPLRRRSGGSSWLTALPGSPAPSASKASRILSACCRLPCR